MSDENVTPFPVREIPKQYKVTYHITYRDPNTNDKVSVAYDGYGMVGSTFFAVQNEQLLPVFVIPADLLLEPVTTTIEEVIPQQFEQEEDDGAPRQVH